MRSIGGGGDASGSGKSVDECIYVSKGVIGVIGGWSVGVVGGVRVHLHFVQC